MIFGNYHLSSYVKDLNDKQTIIKQMPWADIKLIVESLLSSYSSSVALSHELYSQNL
jgi:hypothetical protein